MASDLRRLNPYLRRYWRLMVPGLLCALVSAIFALVVPVVVREAIDAIPRMVELHAAYRGTPAEAGLYGSFVRALLLAEAHPGARAVARVPGPLPIAVARHAAAHHPRLRFEE